MFQRRTGVAVLLLVMASQFLAAQAPSPASATVAGTWTGTVVVRAETDTYEEPLHAVLKQDGNALTGTAGPDADRQYRISNGKVATAKDVTTVTFDVIVNGVHMTLDLKRVDGALKGTAAIEGEDGQRHAATVTLKPAK